MSDHMTQYFCHAFVLAKLWTFRSSVSRESLKKAVSLPDDGGCKLVVPIMERHSSEMRGSKFDWACISMALTACLLATLVPSLAAGASPNPFDPLGAVHVDKVAKDLTPAPQNTIRNNTSTKYFHFDVRYEIYTVNCNTKPILTVNGQFPGPTIYANEDDRIIVNVTNSSPSNITIHFHGTRQERTPWMDGVAYITQCPIQPGNYFVHDFNITRQKGTLLWHAHIGWMRATVHGAFITTPAEPAPYDRPYATPYEEFPTPLIFAEWFNYDIEELERSTLRSGGTFPLSNAGLINGKAGPNYNCSKEEGTTTLSVTPGKTYLLRVINAAIDANCFLALASHNLKVVAADAEYVQPFEARYLFLSPGQTTDVLISADQRPGDYYLAIGGYNGRDRAPPEHVLAILRYNVSSSSSHSTFFSSVHQKADRNTSTPVSPYLPRYNDTGAFKAFTNALRSHDVGQVPLTVNTTIFWPIGLSTRLCNNSNGDTCTHTLFEGDNDTFYGLSGNVFNYTLKKPTIDLMDAMWFGIPDIYEEDFPYQPTSEQVWDYTHAPASPTAHLISQVATKVVPIDFNASVQIILQDTNVVGVVDHPFHLHGHNFYIVGQGYGNWDEMRDPISYNLWDPPLRNTVSVPMGGWAALRFLANNPGMWLFHCHFDEHTSWGMMTVLHVKNATDAEHAMLPPPEHRPQCLKQ